MKAVLKVEKEFEIKYLQVSAGVRYWEDTTVSGIKDEEGDLIPCREHERWCPLIDIDSGKILNWKEGIEADIHYKVCDDGTYKLLDENKEVIKERDGYVPDIMCPTEQGYGDYIIMKVDASGNIENWKPDISDFADEDE